jgi:DNA-binding CsgD family transcriptional regulator/tetratricopeptide (TPR) repeat protein
MQEAAGKVIGRDAVLGEVSAFLTAATHEFAQLTVLGEPGIGKTTVLQEAVRLARARGAGAMVTRPSESEATLSLAALTDLFDPVDDAMIAQREAVSAALLRVPAEHGGIDERALCASVLSLLRLMAADGPVVVAIDDAQWLDSASARVLSFAARRLQTEAIGLLLTVRTGTTPPLSFDVAADPHRRSTIQLGPLTLAALHELIKQRTQRSLPRHILVQIARASSGNALYALEIAAELAVRDGDGDRLPVPSSLTDLVAARVRRLSPASRRAVLIAAALANPTIDLVDPASLRPAERAGLIRVEGSRIRFVHPLFASAVYGQADESERRRLHRRLAEAVTQPEEQARHAALGAAEPDEAIAGTLHAAAAQASWRGAPDAAAELFELSVALTPADNAADRALRSLAAAHCWFDTGDLVRSQAILVQAVSEPPSGQLRAQALQLLGQIHARRSSFTQATHVTFEALALAGDDTELRAALELDLAYYCVSLADLAGAQRHATAAVTAAEAAAVPGALADALAVLTIAEFLCGQGLDETRMQRARALEDPRRVRAWQMRPSFVHGLMQLWTGRLDDALSIFDQIYKETRERGEESAIPFLCLYMTWTCLWRGDISEAAGHADEARQTAALLDDPAAQGTSLAASALVHAHDGSAALAQQEAISAVGCFQGIDWPSGTVWPLWALALAELANGNPAAVDAALGPLAGMLASMGERDPVLGVFLPDHVEALVELGQLDRAEPLVAWLEQRGAELDRAWAIAAGARCRGLLLAARRDQEGALAALASAIAAHDRVAMPFERARTLLILGRVQRRSGQRGRAEATLRDALMTFDRLGTPAWAARTRAELDRLGRRAAMPGLLTPSEERVAELAASGLSNKEIAERAFLTTKAVEANLTRVYRKLDIRSRGGLERALRGVGQERRR